MALIGGCVLMFQIAEKLSAAIAIRNVYGVLAKLHLPLAYNSVENFLFQQNTFLKPIENLSVAVLSDDPI
jgi:hypothetical protein